MKKIAILIIALMATSLIASLALAGGPQGQAGKSNTAHLYLYEKDSNWEIVEDGAWGKMKYNLSGPTFDFVFNGHELDPDADYCLIYYADKPDRFVDWGGDNPGALIASGTSNEGGNIHLAGSIELDMDLPCSPDWNINPDPNYCDYNNGFDDYDHCCGAKIWLVPSDDYNAATKKVSAWNPSEFLFESDLITYDDTDV